MKTHLQQCRNASIGLLIVLGLGSNALGQQGFLASHHPLPQNKRLTLQNCGSVTANKTTNKTSDKTISCQGANISWQQRGDAPVLRLSVAGRTQDIGFDPMPYFIDRVFASDINNDQQPDYIVLYSSLNALTGRPPRG
jgi:hypothetical protein